MKSAVGTLASCITVLAKALLDSKVAANFEGPKMGSPSFLNASTIPSANESSGPTTVRPIFSALANSTNPLISSDAIGTLVANAAVPGLPGAQKIAFARGESDNFQAKACSRPPLPTTKTFIAALAFLGCLGREKR